MAFFIYFLCFDYVNAQTFIFSCRLQRSGKVMSKLALERKPALSTPSSKKKLARCTSDRISILPSEILGSILSLLTLKEAVGTSLLSKRWVHLWKLFTGSLIFDASKKLFCGNVSVVKRERSKYVKWLNKVIDSHESNSIDELCVWFDLDESFSSDIDKWIKFAFSKRVQRLTVDLHRVMLNDVGENCSFQAGCLEIPNRSFNMKFLTSLCFRFVNITGKILEYFLSNCPLLEILSVTGSENLEHIVVPSSALQLKCLEIFSCYLYHVEIKAPNLVTLKYHGPKAALHIGNLSKLVDLTFGGKYTEYKWEKILMFSSYLGQLEFLKLSTTPHVLEMDWGYIGHYLPKLKHLTFQDFGCIDAQLLGWFDLIKAASSLQKCTLELQEEPRWVRTRNLMRSARPLSHQCLEVVEVLGFQGKITQLDLVLYMIKSSMKLKKLIIDRRKPRLNIPTPAWDFKETKKTQAAKVCAMQLEKKLPPGVELVIK